MSGKYMKVKRIIIPTLTMIILASQLFGCGAATQEETTTMIEQTTEVEIEVAEPETEVEVAVPEQTISSIDWTALGDLTTHAELRQAVEDMLGIVTNDSGEKTGILYFDTETSEYSNNNTLYLAMQNANFTESVLLDEEQLAALGNIAVENYTDIDVDDESAAYATINAYFELLPDTSEDGTFNGTESLTREQAMALVMRATTKVSESGEPESDDDFISAVGYDEYTDFAAAMDEYAYINTSNGLNTDTITSTMSRGEYISMLMSLIFKDYEGEIPSVELVELQDAGDISYTDAIKDAAQGVPSDMYATLQKAIALGIIDEDSLDWDSSITKSDAVELLVSTIRVYNECVGYVITASGESDGTAGGDIQLTDEEYQMMIEAATEEEETTQTETQTTPSTTTETTTPSTTTPSTTTPSTSTTETTPSTTTPSTSTGERDLSNISAEDFLSGLEDHGTSDGTGDHIDSSGAHLQ